MGVGCGDKFTAGAEALDFVAAHKFGDVEGRRGIEDEKIIPDLNFIAGNNERHTHALAIEPHTVLAVEIAQ